MKRWTITFVILGLLASGWASADEITIGTGTSTWNFPLYTFYHNVRIQTIYLASEMVASSTISSLSLNVTVLPGKTMNNFTIRMRHTDLSAYGSSPVWESTGWTTVYQANQTISTTGWVQFNFSTPFSYNASQNLMVDISFNNSSISIPGECRCSVPGGARSIYAYTYDSETAVADPLTWSEQLPSPYSTTYITNLKLGVTITGIAVPSFSRPAGAYNSQQSVIVACATAGATIHYTTNGVDPTESDPVVASGGSILVDHSLALKARAWKTGFAASPLQSATYTIVVATPSFSVSAGTYNVEKSVTVTCATTGATIHYTTNGVDPTDSDATIVSGSSILVDRTLTLKAKAWKGAMDASLVSSALYTTVVATPVFAPAAGTYNVEQNVVVTCATTGATIHYTTNGIEPTESDPVVASGGSVLVDRSLTLKAKAWISGGGLAPSVVASAAYTIVAATPVLAPGGGKYGTPQNVVVTCATAGATIHYTTNGADPAEGDPVIASGASVLVDHPFILKARAWKGAMTPSAVCAGVYIVPSTQPGSIVGWGLDTRGDTKPPSGTGYKAIAAGSYHSIALRADGSIVGWGSNYSYDGSIYYGQATPPSGTGFVAIAAGLYHSLALRADGSIVGWGYNDYGQATPPTGTGFVAISAGGYFSLALRADGSIVGWGYNYSGEATPPTGTWFVAISAGGNHGLALRADGSIVGWGYNNQGQATPPTGTGFVAISAGGNHNLALRIDGSIAGWGYNAYGQATPPTGTKFVGIAAASGGLYSLALLADGSVVSWGFNMSGQTNCPSGTGFMAIAAGGGQSLAIEAVAPPFTADFVVVAKRRVGRTVFDYDCKVVLTNNSGQNARVTQLQLQGVPANMSLIDASVSGFGDIAAGGSATSSDTCTFRVDRSQAIDASQVGWLVTYQLIGSGQTMQLASVSEMQLEPRIAGDVNGDGAVDSTDLVLFSTQWLGERPSGHGVINFTDYAILASQWAGDTAPE